METVGRKLKHIRQVKNTKQFKDQKRARKNITTNILNICEQEKSVNAHEIDKADKATSQVKYSIPQQV